MCHSCWEQFGSPVLDTPIVRAAVALIGRVYELHVTGGGVHCIVDDFNIEDEYIERDGYPGNTPDQIEAEERLVALFETMTILERASALAMYHGYTSVEEPRPNDPAPVPWYTW